MLPLLHYRLLNPEAQGVPLVLMAGLFGAGENLTGVSRIERFAERPIALLDLRNHGKSFHADSMTLAEMASDVARVIESLGWAQADVLGHSLGGKVALQLAQSRPELVHRLVVADIAPVAYPSRHSEILQGLQAVDLSAVKSRRDADAQLQAYVPEVGVRNFLLMNLVRLEEGGYGWRINLSALVANYEELRAAPRFQAPYRGQTLYVCGERSDYVAPAYHDAIMRFTPNARIETLAGCGHWLHAEKPAEFNALIEQFLT